MTVQIVRAGPGDVEAIAPLFDAYRQFYSKPADPAAALRFIGERLAADDSVIFLARRDGDPAGFAQLYPTFTSVGLGKEWILNDLFVAPRHRRAGIAAALIERTLQLALETGAVSIELLTEHENTPAQALYERFGFQRDTFYRRYTRRFG